MTRALLWLCMLVLPLRAHDPAEILRRSVELDQADNERLKNYTYLQTLEAKIHHGKKSDTTEINTSEITMLAGRQYSRLISRDGKPLSEKEDRQQQEKMDKEFAK